MVAMALRQPPEREARVQRADLTRLLAMAGFGAVLGPVALAWGLQRTGGSSASLMLPPPPNCATQIAIVMPPSATSVWPVMKLEASLLRKTAAPARSCGVPQRNIGVRLRIHS